MLTLEEIKQELQDMNASAISDKTGLSRQLVSSIKNGTAKKPSYDTIKILSDYLESNG